MPSFPTIRKVTTVVTGVAGAPYYITGYFGIGAVSASAQANAWHVFVTGAGVASELKKDATYTTGPEVPTIDPATGNVIDVQIIPPITVTGTSQGFYTPPSVQILAKWKTDLYQGARRVQGHTNLPLVSSGASGPSGQPTPEAISIYQTRINQLLAGDGQNLAIWSRKTGVAQKVTVGSVWPKFAVLRSRRD